MYDVFLSHAWGKDHAQLVQCFIKGGGVGFLVAISTAFADGYLSGSEASFQCAIAVHSLSALAWQPNCARTIVQLGGINSLIRLANSEASPDGLLEDVAATLGAIASHGEHAELIAHTGGLCTLIKLSTAGGYGKHASAEVQPGNLPSSNSAVRERAGEAVAILSSKLAGARRKALWASEEAGAELW